MIDPEVLFGPLTKADATYLVLRNEIILGTLLPSSRIDPGQLSKRFGLSITPLREALHRLEGDHLVVRSAHRDVVVAALSFEEARNLVEMRDVLDVAAVRMAVERMTDEEIDAAAKIIEHQDVELAIAYLRTNKIPLSSAGSLATARAFHRMLYCGSHNDVLIQDRDVISARAERYVVLARRMSTEMARPHYDSHAELLDAVRHRDSDLAASLMATHTASTGGDFTRVIFGQDGESRAFDLDAAVD